MVLNSPTGWAALGIHVYKPHKNEQSSLSRVEIVLPESFMYPQDASYGFARVWMWNVFHRLSTRLTAAGAVKRGGGAVTM